MSTSASSEIIPGFLCKEDADRLQGMLQEQLNWYPKEWFPGYTLPQLVYEYEVEERQLFPIPCLEELIERVESQFNVQTNLVWCNRFRDGGDYIDWHQDQYGQDLYVFSFGVSRSLETYALNNGEVQEFICSHGGLYRWTSSFDKEHEHRLPKSTEKGERISVLLLVSNGVPLDPIYSGVCDSCGGYLGKEQISSRFSGAGMKALCTAMGSFWLCPIRAARSIETERVCKSCSKHHFHTTD
ncbi:unnamed protein product [Discosporangium mesarthrocarpum]